MAQGTWRQAILLGRLAAEYRFIELPCDELQRLNAAARCGAYSLPCHKLSLQPPLRYPRGGSLVASLGLFVVSDVTGKEYAEVTGDG